MGIEVHEVVHPAGLRHHQPGVNECGLDLARVTRLRATVVTRDRPTCLLQGLLDLGVLLLVETLQNLLLQGITDFNRQVLLVLHGYLHLVTVL